MNLIIDPTVSGNLGTDTKNIYVVRSLIPTASLVEADYVTAGLEVGDSIYLTDSDNLTALYIIEALYVLATYSTSATGGTDLAYVAAPSGGVVTSSTGTSAGIPGATITNSGLLNNVDKTKLDGIVAPVSLVDATTPNMVAAYPLADVAGTYEEVTGLSIAVPAAGRYAISVNLDINTSITVAANQAVFAYFTDAANTPLITGELAIFDPGSSPLPHNIRKSTKLLGVVTFAAADTIKVFVQRPGFVAGTTGTVNVESNITLMQLPATGVA